MHQSIATIDSPQFINLQPLEINPLMSACEIKVLYLGENRNHSYITKEVATEMAKTLRGAPIVGYYKQDKGDFADHGERVVLDDEGIKFECLTKPYGFFAPDAKVWFQTFEDYDDFGNSVKREYLMTTGFLWTGQFEECAAALDGKPQSMELDENSLQGNWSTNNKTGIDFFIINDAIFSKLCILGDDVEPCFEGASVTDPQVSKTFNLNNDFKQTLYTMMQDLRNFALGGGQPMENLDNSVVEESAEVATEFDASEAAEETAMDSQNEVDTSEAETEFKREEEADVTENSCKDPEKKFDEADAGDDAAAEPEAQSEDEDEVVPTDDEDDIPAKKNAEFELLQTSYDELKSEYAILQTKYLELVEFKAGIEDAKKDELINKFYMLSDEDKADVIANKSTYSYEDIEAKLSVICFRKKVNFDLEDNSKNDNEVEEKSPALTFNIESNEVSVPAYISALNNARNKK